MRRIKMIFFMDRIIATMLAAVMLAGTLPETIISYASEKETKSAWEEDEIAEIEEVKETEQTEQTNESLILKTQIAESEPIISSVEYETDIVEPEEDSAQLEMPETVTETTIEEEEHKITDSGSDAGFSYYLYDNEAWITGYSGGDTSMNIPSTVDGYTVTTIWHEAFRNNTSIESVSMPDTITIIGDEAFTNCTGLTSIKLSKGLESIGWSAFKNCTGLTSIEIPKSLNRLEILTSSYLGPFEGCSNLKTVSFEEGTTRIISKLFNYCKGIENLELPDTITDIEEHAFYGCTGLTNIKFPDGLERIGKYAFAFCKNLTSIELPDSITNIESCAFYECVGLTNVKLPKGLESTGYGVFENCTGLTSIEIPKSLVAAEKGAFKGCNNLKTVSFEEGTTQIISNILQNNVFLEEIKLPDTVICIEDYAFSQCTRLKQVIMPDSIISIGNYAFNYCTGLTNVKLSKNLENMGFGAFRFCTKLNGIEIPKSLKTVGVGSGAYDEVFKGCENLKTASFEEGTTQIVNRLFENCIYLEKIEMPNTVTDIGNNAFCGCTGLTDVKLSNSLERIQASAFSDCSSLADLELPYTIISIGNYAFSSCVSLTDIKLPRGLTTIGSGAFGSCTGLTDIELPKGLTTMGSSAFGSCTGLTDIELPKSLKEIGSRGIFAGCTNLKSIRFEIGITQISDYLLRNCIGLEHIKIPDTVTEIGEYAFADCVNLVDIELPDTIYRIDWYAFKDCSALQRITIPYNVSRLSNDVLVGCTGLKEIVFSHKMTSIPSFKNYPNLEKVELPANLNSIPEYGFYNTKLTEIQLPQGLAKIGAYAFSNTKLTQIQLPDCVETIGERTFAGCDNLSEVQMSANITKIPAYAFDHCQLLNNVILPASVTEIEAYAFASCPSLTSITIPRETTVIDADVFYNSDNVTIYGIQGSYAETYAKENDIKFEYVSISATQLEVSPECPTISRGRTLSLSLIVKPEDFTDEVQWITEDPDIVTVSDQGVLYGVSVGTAIVRVTVGNLSKDIEVTVKEPVSQITLNRDLAELKVGDTFTLIATVSPDNATDKGVIWSSSNKAVAKVNENGVVTAMSKGTTIVSAKAADGSGRSASCKVTVKDKDEVQGGTALIAIYFTQNSVQLSVGEGYKMAPVYDPSDAKKDAHVTWESSNPDIVDVDGSGYITALAFGTSVITVTSVENPELNDSCLVSVVNDDVSTKDCTITFETNGGSSIEPVLCKSGRFLANLIIEAPEKEKYIFGGWYKDFDCTMPWRMDSDIVTEDIVLYASWLPLEEGLWAVPVTSQTYTGKAIKPSVVVFSGATKLVLNRDYSVSYKNNTNVYTGGSNAKKPQIIIKGKGNYKDSKIIYFDILPKQISDTDVIFSNLYVTANTRPKQLIPIALWNTKKLKYNKNASKSDYKVTVPNVNYDTVGTYPVTVTGLGNYGGTIEINLIVSDKEALDKASISVTKSMPYKKGSSVLPTDIVVKLKGKTLSKNSDYIVICKNNTEIGTATATIRGIGKYCGEKQVNFNIVGKNIKNASIRGIINKEYTGEAVIQDYSVWDESKQLKPNKDFTLQYQNNVYAGTATMIFTGINDYSGTVKKTFKIIPFDIQANRASSLEIDCSDTAEYRKSGAQLNLTIFLKGRRLIPDIDYKLSYKNNRKVGSAQLQIKGIGNLKGSISKSFSVIEANGFHETADKSKDISKAKVTVKDQIYTGEEIKIDSSDIVSITIGTVPLNNDDYEILEDTYQNNVKKGTAKVTIRGKNAYGNEKQISFKIVTKSVVDLK